MWLAAEEELNEAGTAGPPVKIEISLSERILSYLHPSDRSISNKLWDIPLQNMEREWVRVAGSLSEPVTASNMHQFLTFVLVDHPLPISTYNCGEFCDILDKKLDVQVRINFGEIAKAFRDRDGRQTINASFIMIGSALSPQSIVHRAWTLVIRIICLYLWMSVPVRLAFLPYDTFTDRVALSTDLPADIFIVLHVVVLLNTAVKPEGRSGWTTQRFKIFKETDFLFLFGAIPLDWLGYLCGISNEACCWLRFNKLVLYLSRSSPRDVIFSSGEYARGKVADLFIIMFFYLHMLACVYFWLGRAQPYLNQGPSVSWLFVDPEYADTTYDRQAHFATQESATTAQQYLFCIYWVAATITVNGAVGWFIPQNIMELIFTTIIMALNMTLYRWIMGEVSSIIMSSDDNVVKARAELEAVTSFASGKRFSQEVRDAEEWP